ncbi:MAG TPA: hypothetical protein PLW97_13790, partial [Synergistaceae bacterium]|nr:hypothetical protein [Synergistaceae bacterium]
SSEPFFLALLSFLPPVRKRREARDRVFLLEHALEFPPEGREGVRQALGEKRSHQEHCVAQWEQSLKNLQESLSQLEQRWQTLQRAAEEAGLSLKGDALSQNGVIQKLDTVLRARAFRLASHYWEGMYLEELRKKLYDSTYWDSASPEKKARMYRRFAKLLPCQIATFYMLPHYYCGYQKEIKKEIFMFNEIDLLIVDEAGQVSPEIGTPSFALAKKALVVGDTFQIEPVWSVASGTDSANALESGVISSLKKYEEEEPRGYYAASGNLMRMAQLACNYTQYEELCPGMMLVEHRRCLPEIIAYCNDLVYHGKLEPHRRQSPEDARKRPAFLPMMGEIPVLGAADERSSGSRRNRTEAEAIAGWVKEHRKELEEAYGKEIAEILGIVTPF